MRSPRVILLLGLLLEICSLAFGQDTPAVKTPGTPPAAVADHPADNAQTGSGTPATDVAPVPAKPKDLAVIYNGEDALSPQIVMGGWGYIQSDPEFKAFTPHHLTRKQNALYISSLGRYNGVRFDFAEPLVTSQVMGAKNEYLELYLRALPAKSTTTSTSTTTPPPATTPSPTSPVSPINPMGPGGYPMMGPNGPMMGPNGPMMGPNGPLMGPNGYPMMGQPPAARQPDADVPKEFKTTTSPTVDLPKLTNLRFTFFSEKGAMVITVPSSEFYPKEEIDHQWIRIGIPLSKLDPAIPFGEKITRMVITTDQPAAFLLGRMAFVLDDTPLTLDTLILPQFYEAGQRIFFIARVKSGLTRVETTWNFDTSHANSTDATGEHVTFTYDKEGVYTMRCTVRDLYGGKASISKESTLKISRPAGQ